MIFGRGLQYGWEYYDDDYSDDDYSDSDDY